MLATRLSDFGLSNKGINATLYLDNNVVVQHHKDKVEQYREEYQKHGYVKFKGFINEELIDNMVNDLESVGELSDAKCFTMPGYQTPRKLSVLGGEKILSLIPNLGMLYFHHEIRDFIKLVRGVDVHSVKHVKEFMVVNMLQARGDTHGWHLDDPEMALVIFLKSPSVMQGGQLEYIPGWDKLCDKHGINSDACSKSNIEKVNASELVVTDRHEPGDAYLLNASRILHRVSPIQSKRAQRWVMNLAFDTRVHIDFGATADLLYN